MSKRADVSSKLKDLAETAIAEAALVSSWSLLPRVELKPARVMFEIPPEGLIVIRDLGMHSEITEFGLGSDKTTKEITLTHGVEAYASEQSLTAADDAVDAIMTAFGELIEADPTLGGLVEECSLDEGEAENFEELGVDRLAGERVTLTSTWSSERTLG